MVKALLRYLEAKKGVLSADGWLKVTRLERDDLEDETRPLPLGRLHAALEQFVLLCSREDIAGVFPHLMAPDNLGNWMRVLRGTTTPGEAFHRLDSSESEYGRTTRWEMVAESLGYWRGRVHIAHDPALEADGLLQLSRLVELSVVPALFGFGRGQVTPALGGLPRASLAQDYEVRWRVPKPRRAAMVGGAVGLLFGTSSLLPHPSLVAGGWGAGWVTAGLGVGAVVGMAVGRDRARRAEMVAQSMRVRALERSLLLRELREGRASGALEGSVVAGQYRIQKRMGSGGSGVIYEAVRIGDGLPVALKLLRTVAAHDVVASDRLRREAEALRLAWHPNVVEVFDHGLLGDGTAYLVMELLRGETLSSRLTLRQRLTPEELLPIASQVCDALVAVHAAGVVHRDLKPSNIFLSQAAEGGGQPERVKLIDFGIARVEWQETRITNTGSPVGTPGYMSPEQETGGEIDARSDIFALGACLYESLVGEPPPPTPSGLWVAIPPAAAGGRFDSGIHDGTSQAMPGRGLHLNTAKLIPPRWRAVMEKAMAPLPRERFPDARAFAQALRELGREKEDVEASSSPR